MPWHFAFYVTGGSWRWRNIQSRIIGIGFVSIGLLHFAAGVFGFVVEMRTPPKDGHSPAMNLIFVASGLVSMAIGRWLCRKPAYRPDLGDVHPWLGKAGGYNDQYVAEQRRAARTWWTGDPLRTRDRDRDA